MENNILSGEFVCKEIDALFENTVNNILVVDNLDESFDEERTKYSCTMNWTKADAEKAKEDFSNLFAQIQKISFRWKSEPLLEDLFEIYSKYIKDFEERYDVGNIEDSDSIEGKIFLGKELTKEEQEYYDKYIDDLREQANDRLGEDNQFSLNLISRARRFCRLLQLNAPQIVVENEVKAFATSYVLFRFCKDIEQVK